MPIIFETLRPPSYTPDASLALTSGTTTINSTTSAAGTVVDIGNAYCEFDVVIDVLTFTVDGADDLITFQVEGSVDASVGNAAFSATTYPLGHRLIGHETAIAAQSGGGNARQAATTYVIHCDNMALDTTTAQMSHCQSIRLRHKAAGTGPAATYTARIVKKAGR